MLHLQLQQLISEYEKGRPSTKVKDPISLAYAIKNARFLRADLQGFLTMVARDESEFLARFNEETAGPEVGTPSVFNSVPQQQTIIETIREFIRRNRDEEFTQADVVEACSLHGKSATTVRGLLHRLHDQGVIQRPQRGVYKAAARKKKRARAKIEEHAE